MRADTQLEYAVFRLTPTRTRCELLVVALGTAYKLASGLVQPFIDHLRAAEEQIAKGGYSIRLEPPDPGHTKWFTKGTMERFVRFVSTPEVLERVSTVDIELTELEETVRKQENESSDGKNMEDEEPLKILLSSAVGGKSVFSINIDRPSTKDFVDGADNGIQENTKQRLLRALEARQGMLQKEQGMAFARAIAAGFSIEQMDDLISFAQTFGAARFESACSKFMALCKKRQESGLWEEDLELAAAEHPDAWHGRPDELRRASFPVDGKLLMGKDGSQNFTRRGSLDNHSAELSQQLAAGVMSNGIAGEQGLGGVTPGLVSGHPVMVGWQGQPPAQYMQNIHPPLYASPAGIPYPPHISNPYLQPSYSEGNNWQACAPVPPMYWQGSQASMPAGLQTYKEGSVDKDGEGNDFSDDDQGEYIVDAKSKSEPRRKSHRRSISPRRRSVSPSRGFHVGRSGRSGTVVIRNINYISPNAQCQGNVGENDGNSSERHSEDDSIVNESLQQKAGEKMDRGLNKLAKTGYPSPGENLLDESLFLARKRVHSDAKVYDAIQMQSNVEVKKDAIQEDVLPFSKREGKIISNAVLYDVYSGERQQERKIVSGVDESFILPTKNRSSGHIPVVDGDLEISNTGSSTYKQNPSDDSFILCRRGVTREEPDHDWRTHLDMESEMPGKQDINVDGKTATNKADFCEPDELFIVPDRNKDTSSRNPIEYDMQVLAADMMECRHNQQSTSNCESDSTNMVSVDEPKESTTPSGKVRKSKEMIDKRKMTTINRSVRSSPLTEAQLRADKLRAYKADLQKVKKEKEEEERKRIEDLKRQRQARIAARTALNSSSSTKTIGTTASKSLSTVPISNKKISSSSQNIYSSMNVNKVRDLTGIKSSRVSGLVSKTADTALSRSVSSLSDLRKEKVKTTPLTRASTGSQLKNNLKDGSYSPASASKTNVDKRTEDNKKQSSPSTTSVVKSAVPERGLKSTSMDSPVKNVKAMSEGTSSVKTPTKETNGERTSSVKSTSNREKDVKKSSTKLIKTSTIQAKQEKTNGPKKVSALKTSNILHATGPKKVSILKTNDTATSLTNLDSNKESALNLVEGGTVKDEVCNNIVSCPLAEETYAQRDNIKHRTEEETVSKGDATATEANDCVENSLTEANDCIETSPTEANKITVTGNTGRPDSGYAHIRARLSSDVLGVTGAFDTTCFQDDARPPTHPSFSAGESHQSIPIREQQQSVVRGSSPNADTLSSLNPDVSYTIVRKGYHAPVARLSSIDWDSGNRRKSDSDEKDVTNISAALANVVLSDRYFPASTSNQSQSPVTPSKILPRLHEAIQQESESDSKKKLSLTSKTPPSKESKGLKRLLLLGRRSSRGSPGELVSSPGELDEDRCEYYSSNGSNVGIGSIANSDSSSRVGQPLSGKSDNSGSSSSKASKSFFSLSTFRGKGEGKA